MSDLARIRASYDTVAGDYADLLRAELDDKPFDRAMLALFAELVLAAGGGRVADLGCGPGRVTAHLHAIGLDAFGIDLSPGMVEVARRDHPGLQFHEGSMHALDLPDNSLAGAVAWYSIVHTAPDELPVVFAEFHRVVAPGGHLLLAFKDGDQRRHLSRGYGHDVSLDVYWQPTDKIAAMLEDVGFTELSRLVRAPDQSEGSKQSFLVLRKP